MKIPTVTPASRCKLRTLRLERIKDFLLIEQEFVENMKSHKKNMRFYERQIRNLSDQKDVFDDEVEDDDTTDE